jgi:hypothetical protein
MAITTLEGTWEDIVKESSAFAGRRVRVTVVDREPTPGHGDAPTPSLLGPEERIALLNRVLAMNAHVPSITDDALNRELIYAEDA